MKDQKLPAGWTQDRIDQVLAHYEGQSEDEAVAEDDAAFGDPGSLASMRAWLKHFSVTSGSGGFVFPSRDFDAMTDAEVLALYGRAKKHTEKMRRAG